jgi:hypothetical protein
MEHNLKIEALPHFGLKITCLSEGCNHEELFRKKGTSDYDWQRAIDEFKKKHPSPQMGHLERSIKL